MAQSKKTVKITVAAEISATIEKVWNYWTLPEHIINWTFADPSWHSPRATNNLRKGGKFFTRMEARDGSFGFDFEGIYSQVTQYKTIKYFLADDRKITILFEKMGENACKVTETFDTENENPVEMQQGGWQAILNNFKDYVENN